MASQVPDEFIPAFFVDEYEDAVEEGDEEEEPEKFVPPSPELSGSEDEGTEGEKALAVRKFCMWGAEKGPEGDEYSGKYQTDDERAATKQRYEAWRLQVQAKYGGILSVAEELRAPFYCSGSLSLPRPLIIACNHNTMGFLNFPGASSEEIGKLASECDQATFGRGDQDVYDPNYRSCLKLDYPQKFLTSFDPASNGILTAVRGLLAPNAPEITAELYKLNLYRTGDFFKAHVDTPRQGLLGSLVVVLPYPHTGGELVVKHKGDVYQLKIDQAAASSVHWAAFYSDCEHEVQPVTSGYRLTLTYNLYLPESSAAALTSTLDSTMARLQAAFMDARLKMAAGSDPVLLGYPCEHYYPFFKSGEVKSPKQMQNMLKGVDAMLLAAAKGAGLQAQVRPVWKIAAKRAKFVGKRFGSVVATDWEIGDHFKVQQAFPMVDTNRAKPVTWIKDRFDWQVGAVALAHGNQPSLTQCYRAVAIVVKLVPLEV